MSMGLTVMQSKCLEVIKSGVEGKGRSPSIREIANELELASAGGVIRLLNGLEERGAIRRLPHKARAIEVVPENERRSVVVNADLWAPLIRYAIAEKINLETAVNQFIRDGLESA